MLQITSSNNGDVGQNSALQRLHFTYQFHQLHFHKMNNCRIYFAFNLVIIYIENANENEYKTDKIKTVKLCTSFEYNTTIWILFMLLNLH